MDETEEHVVRSPEALSRTLLDGVLVLTPAGEFLQLDPVGDLIWRMTSQPTDRRSLVNDIAEALSVDPTTILADIELAVNELITVGALRRCSVEDNLRD